MYSKQTKALRGFTLLEMLIAIAIFAMLGLAANTVLSTVMKNDTATRDFAAKLKAMQQGFGVIERDLNQMVARTPRLLEGGRGTTVFQTGSNMLDSESESLVFFRLGWLNPDGLLPRGSLQSVAYVVMEGQLQRWYYPYPEPEIGAEPIKTVIMDKVISVEYAFFTDDKWERKTDATKLPKAIAIEIEFEDIGKVQRKFLVPTGALAGSNDDSNNGGNNNGGNNNGGNDNNNGNNSGSNNGGNNGNDKGE
ncbi:type II secretion system minor pseudopilin GspJ [Shewanella sp. Isolate13]|uniref:type II secretion system minor pseudopilin GspJ n=1 Tax=Shewanella sp. Isolate13 TaxID=2908531 RepID=UPI001EFC6A2C|nr:type II secretion system minor pseudopilin GspJ [Shewanella sp. Isolate13]MCG9732113.1 type II secretion system minor pseudopilin GspJ [Shewanella sp. Isolate13]